MDVKGPAVVRSDHLLDVGPAVRGSSVQFAARNGGKFPDDRLAYDHHVRYRPSLYWRLTLALLGPLLLAMLAAWAIGVGIVSQSLEQRVERQSRNAARVLAASGLPYTPELLRRLAAMQQADFVLVDRAGKVALATSPDVGAALEASLGQFVVNPGHDVPPVRFEQPSPAIAVYEPIAAQHDPRYAALVAVVPLADAQGAARRAALGVGIAMLAAALLLAALLLTLVRGITRPLGELAAFANRIAAGEREERLELASGEEIRALAESLNAMVVRLADYESRLASRSRLAALGDMSARLAHEIRNPLTGIKLHLQLLAERADPRETARMKQLLAEVQRLELLVSSTLMLGGEQPLSTGPVDLPELVGDVLDLMQPSLEHRGITVERDCVGVPGLNADRARLRQALLNLVVNAADAMPRGGRLCVRTQLEAPAQRALVAVEDSGPGVSGELRATLQTDPVSTKPFGLGLGLVVCRDVAAAHGGELRIERSAALGGARFVLAIPLQAANEPSNGKP
jgi:signal transduction histidine kinase